MTREGIRKLVRTLWTPAILMIGLLVFGAVGTAFSSDFEVRITTMLVDVTLVVGLYSFVGLSGVVSFGHVSFVAIGAYATALMTIPPAYKKILLPDLPDWLSRLELDPAAAVLVAGAAAAVFALAISAAVVRLNGIAASIAMLSVLSIIYILISQNETITRGNRGMTGIPFDLSIGRPLVVAVLAIVAVYLFQESSGGLRLRATREDEFGARGIGISVARARLPALVLSAFVMGVGGGLDALLVGALSPGSFYLNLTFTTLVMLVVGGMGSLTGAVAGTVVMSAVSQALNSLEQGTNLGFVHIPARPGLQLVGVAVVALAVLLYRPRGITGGREIPIPRWLRGRPAEPDRDVARDRDPVGTTGPATHP